MNILEVQDIHTYYGDVCVLHGISLMIKKGSIVAVLGRNGAGKTTLIRSIIGFTPPRRGRIFFNGVESSLLPANQIARKGVGLVPQGRRIFPSLTVQENLRIVEPPKSHSGWNMERVFHVFPHLKTRLSHYGGTLSGGEQQMLACGRALITNPQLLLMDEPSEGLAPLLVREMDQLIRLLKEEGMTILLVEQKLRFALGLADYVYVMSGGRIVHESPPQVLEQDDVIRSRYLGV